LAIARIHYFPYQGITPLDNGLLAFTEMEYKDFIAKEPLSEKWFKFWVTGHSFINNYKKYCLWMPNIKPNELRSMPSLMDKIEKVREFRENSKSSQKFADTPWLFRERTIAKDLVIIPKTSSENRSYIPIGFVEDVIVSSSSLMLENVGLYHFGVLTSQIHMLWMRTIAGRLKSDYRYSAKLVYNNYPWPESNEAQKQVIEKAAQAILDARTAHPDSTLADLYDPLTMPANLRKAHNALDKLVEQAYRKPAFKDDAERIKFLFERYQTLIEAEQ